MADETVAETWKDFELSRRLGVTGFPTLLAGSDEGGYEVITAGYRPWEKIKEIIENYAFDKLRPGN
jgi:protein-disulfide isomerase-like protein with CxxC motif